MNSSREVRVNGHCLCDRYYWYHDGPGSRESGTWTKGQLGTSKSHHALSWFYQQTTYAKVPVTFKAVLLTGDHPFKICVKESILYSSLVTWFNWKLVLHTEYINSRTCCPLMSEADVRGQEVYLRQKKIWILAPERRQPSLLTVSFGVTNLPEYCRVWNKTKQRVPSHREITRDFMHFKLNINNLTHTMVLFSRDLAKVRLANCCCDILNRKLETEKLRQSQSCQTPWQKLRILTSLRWEDKSHPFDNKKKRGFKAQWHKQKSHFCFSVYSDIHTDYKPMFRWINILQSLTAIAFWFVLSSSFVLNASYQEN